MAEYKAEAVIFDLGNVLLDFDHSIAAQKISRSTNTTTQEIYDLFFDSELTAKFEEGRISPQEFYEKVKEELNLDLDYNRFVSIWNDIFFFSEKNSAVHNIAKSLKKNYKLALISNINILHFEYIKKNFPLFDIFDEIVTSFEAGFRKPHPLIYKKTLELLRVLPENVFYTDDRAELVSKANELGIKGFVFINIDKLKKDLTSSGININ